MYVRQANKRNVEKSQVGILSISSEIMFVFKVPFDKDAVLSQVKIF